jgi:hypothetical protein
VITVRETGQGKVVSVLTYQPLITSAEEARASRGLGFVELRLGAESGGRLIPAAEIVFGEDGFLQAKSLDGRELELEQVTASRP